MIYQDVSFSTTDGLVVGDGVQTDSVVPTAATEYKRGDLVAIDPATNVATHGTVADFNAIIVEDVTAEQADAALEAGDKAAAFEAYKNAVKKIDQAVAKGIMHKNAAAHKKSAFTLKLNAMA